MSTQSYKELIVWKKGIDLVKLIYLLTSNLPKEELYGLSSQIRRCAISIPSNIAEGSKRGTRKDYAQFLTIAYGSSAELETQLIIISEIYPETKLICGQCDSLNDEIQKILATIIKKLRSAQAKNPITSNL